MRCPIGQEARRLEPGRDIDELPAQPLMSDQFAAESLAPALYASSRWAILSAMFPLAMPAAGGDPAS